MTAPSAVVIADSISPAGHRVTTFRVRFWRPMLPEVNTHGAAVKSSASVRAILGKRMRRMVLADPAGPVEWGAEQRGMVAGEQLTGWRLYAARGLFAAHRYLSVGVHYGLERVGLHKQVTNRVLEAHMWQSQLLTATADGWGNLFAQRCHPDAQPDFRVLAEAIRDAYYASTPRLLVPGQWHTPLLTDEERAQWPIDTQVNVSMARCARESYLTTKTMTVEADLDLARRLLEAFPPHLAPAEHVCTPRQSHETWVGRLGGWRTLRHTRGPVFLPYTHEVEQ